MERVERPARLRLHEWQRGQAAVFAHVGRRHVGGSGFDRAINDEHEDNCRQSWCTYGSVQCR